MKTNNKTELGISTDAERSVWIIWSVSVFLACMIGDSIILLATIKYKAIKHRKVIVVVMQHMAVCDMIQAVFRVFPSILSLSVDRWVLGEFLCQVEEAITFMCSGVAMYLTCAITTFKLLTVKFPLRTGAWSSRLAHQVCACLWLFELCIHFPILVGKFHYIKETLHFSYRVYNCGYNLNSSLSPTWLTAYSDIGVSFITILFDCILIVVSIILLLAAKKAAARHGGRLNWEGVVTVLLTVGVLLISYLPSLVAAQIGRHLKIRMTPTIWRVTVYLQYLNITANFFVYALTVKSFNQFLKKKFSHDLSRSGSGPSNQNLPPQDKRPSRPEGLSPPPAKHTTPEGGHSLTSAVKPPWSQKNRHTRDNLIISNTDFNRT